jgi:hypothetical protein
MTVLVALSCTFDRRDPRLTTLHPDLRFWLKAERSVIERSDPNFDQALTWLGRAAGGYTGGAASMSAFTYANGVVVVWPVAATHTSR